MRDREIGREDRAVHEAGTWFTPEIPEEAMCPSVTIAMIAPIRLYVQSPALGHVRFRKLRQGIEFGLALGTA